MMVQGVYPGPMGRSQASKGPVTILQRKPQSPVPGQAHPSPPNISQRHPGKGNPISLSASVLVLTYCHVAFVTDV